MARASKDRPHPALTALDEAYPVEQAEVGAPTAQVHRSEDGQLWLVQVDTNQDTGVVAVDLNDGRIFNGDPETFDAVAAAEKAMAKVEEDEGDWPTGEMVEAIIAATRGEA